MDRFCRICGDRLEADQASICVSELCAVAAKAEDRTVAAIVAWLRSDDRTAVRPSKAWDVLNWAADAIERGEWCRPTSPLPKQEKSK